MLGYDWWKLETASEACLSSVVEIHEDYSSVPLYPVHLMRYCNSHLYCWLSLELRISEILYLGLLLTLTGGGGGWMWLGWCLELMIRGWRHERLGGQIGGNWGVGG